MKKFRIELQEVFNTIVEVEANNVDEAKAKVQEMWDNSDIGVWKDPASASYSQYKIWEA